MHLAAREVPDQPGIDRAEQQFAVPGPLTGTGHVIENPFELGRRKIGIDDETGMLANVRLQPFGLQLVANSRRAPALPDDGIAHRFAGGLFPNHRGLALVGDADGGNLGGTHTGFVEHFARYATLAAPDLHRIVLDPAGLRVNLGKLLLRNTDTVPGLIKQNGSRTRGSLIKRQHILFAHGLLSPFPKNQAGRSAKRP